MSRKYWKVKPNFSINHEEIIEDLRREGVEEKELHMAYTIREQTLLKTYFSRQTAYCSIDDLPCTQTYCSTCSRGD